MMKVEIFYGEMTKKTDIVIDTLILKTYENV